jgi:hypothetical protein
MATVAKWKADNTLRACHLISVSTQQTRGALHQTAGHILFINCSIITLHQTRVSIATCALGSNSHQIWKSICEFCNTIFGLMTFYRSGICRTCIHYQLILIQYIKTEMCNRWPFQHNQLGVGSIFSQENIRFSKNMLFREHLLIPGLLKDNFSNSSYLASNGKIKLKRN